MGGGVLGNRWLSRRSAVWHCPGRDHAAVLSCDTGGSTVAWTPDSTGAVGAFVWCGPQDQKELDDDVMDRIGELQVASHYCAPLPWTDEKAWGDQKITRARRTLWELDDLYSAAWRRTKTTDEAIAQAEQMPNLDSEVVRLLREGRGADHDRWMAIRGEIARRVGSTTLQCEAPRVSNVESTDDDGVRFSLVLKDPAELPRLTGYLCQLGCRVSVLPASADDRRLRICF
jgi:hypothetical protein